MVDEKRDAVVSEVALECALVIVKLPAIRLRALRLKNGGIVLAITCGRPRRQVRAVNVRAEATLISWVNVVIHKWGAPIRAGAAQGLTQAATITTITAKEVLHPSSFRSAGIQVL
jgi:hypothetical protein